MGAWVEQNLITITIQFSTSQVITSSAGDRCTTAARTGMRRWIERVNIIHRFANYENRCNGT